MRVLDGLSMRQQAPVLSWIQGKFEPFEPFLRFPNLEAPFDYSTVVLELSASRANPLSASGIWQWGGSRI